MNKIDRDGKNSFFVELFRSSLILKAIDKFTSYIYTLLANGFFGYIFTGYVHETRSAITDKVYSSKFSRHMGEFRYGICKNIENSLIVNFVRKIAGFFLKCRLKIYGTYILSFAVYNIAVTTIDAILNNAIGALSANSGVLFSLILIATSIPLLFSRKNLSEGIVNSVIGRFFLKITGYNSNRNFVSHEQCGYSSIAFLSGVIIALLTHSIHPLYVFLTFAAIVWAYVELIKPEIGVLTLFFATPFLKTMFLAAIVIYTFLCWCLKLLRGKRVAKFEPIDIVVMAVTVIRLSGGFISLSPQSLKPALLMVCLIAGYFLTVQLIGSRDWLIRCSVASVISSTIVSLYGIIAYFTGAGYYSQAWLDDEMFGTISGRAVSTLENPNMLGEYLILLLPIAIVMIIGKGEGLRRIPALFCAGIMGVCLILTWSRGAWLALIVALICLFFMWHHRSIWLIVAGVISIPILPSILPSSIISRFASIGNMSDSSTSYRVYIWRAAVNMLKDNAVAGIGVGESAWRRLYPLYSYMGIEVAPHSHNLFIQIWLELGVFGIVAFAAIVFLLFKSVFSLFSKLSSGALLKTPDLSESMIEANRERGRGVVDSQSLSRKQLKISAIGPVTGIIAVLAQGLTDYSWYNYRLYLIFWLVVGLASAYVRNGNSYISENDDVSINESMIETNYVMDNKKKRHNTLRKSNGLEDKR